MLNVLYICHSPNNLGGAVLSLFNMIQSVRQSVNSIVVLQSEGVVSQFFIQHGIECIIANFPNNIRNRSIVKHIITYPLKRILHANMNTNAVRMIKKHLAGRKIDIIHSNASVFIFGDILAQKLHTKHVWHFREFQDIDFNIHSFLGQSDLNHRMARADSLIAITKAVYEHWNFGRYKNSCYIWDAVCKKNDCIFDDKKDKYFLFCAASLDEAKGVYSVVNAFGLSGLADMGYRLKLIGREGTSCVMDNIKGIAYEHNIMDSIDFLGYQKNIKPYMEKATAFVMASHNEGLGRVTIEAMFYGCPVIARASGGTLEFLTDQETGFYFKDDKQCSDLMCQLTSELPVEVIKKAKDFAVNNFSEEVYGEKILMKYINLKEI